MSFIPSYLRSITRDELQRRAQQAVSILRHCSLCPRNCGVNRLEGELGECRAPGELMVSSASPHYGEEPPLVGCHGSGTIFLTHCNLRCVFCQNYDISHLGRGKKYSPEELAETMLGLQKLGCHNINFVTPTHYMPRILQGLVHAVDNGLQVPIVYNCGGYENIDALELLDGIVDIFMPDLKFLDPECSTLYMNAPDYPDRVKEAIKLMHCLVGDLAIDSTGVATRGLLIRHLVMPGLIRNTETILEFIAGELSESTYVNIMDQYYPAYRSGEYEKLNRRISQEEYRQACNKARSAGLYRGFGDRYSG